MKLDQLKAAVVARLLGATNDFKTAIADQFFYVENPNDDKDVIYPYGVFQFVSGNTDRDTGTEFPELIMQATFYDDDLSSADLTALVNRFHVQFHKCEASLSLTDYYVLEVFILSPPREMRTFNDTWQSSVDVKIQLQKK